MGMSGNVWEWCLNLHTDPQRSDLGEGGARVLRGGAWNSPHNLARCAYRTYHYPLYGFNHFGFRVVCARPPSR
jgi:formylglycine-generating enzyme required for sulfatase activity